MSSSTNSENYPFDTEFGEDGSVLNEGHQKYRRYRPDEVKQACDEARNEALASVEAETNRRLAASAEQIAAHIQPVLPYAMSLAEQMRRESAELALAIARKIGGEALRQFPEHSVTACIQQALDLLPKRVALVVKVMPEIADEMRARLSELLPGEDMVSVEGDPSVSPGAWSIAWETGGISGSPEALTEHLEKLVEEYLAQPLNPQGDLFASVA
tara:strand:+ start:27517 stop:28158 length:642 start_codon:yes stop_codon:yes gene_type:complete